MRESGRTTRRMDMGLIHIWMGLGTLDIGWKTSSMERARKLGLTVLDTRGNISRGKNMVEGSFSGPTALRMMVTSLTTIFMDSGSISGQTAEHSRDNGRIIRWRAQGRSLGRIIASM